MSDDHPPYEETDADRVKKAAEAEASLAQAEVHRQEAAKMAAEARKMLAEAEGAEISLAGTRRREEEELAKDRYHHLYSFGSSVTDSSVSSCIDQLTQWRRRDPGCDIEILFNSPGGSVIAGLALYDFIQATRRAGHHVTTSTVGYAASMAGILLQAGDTRVMGRESYVLIHEISTGMVGKIGEIEDEVEFVKKIQKRILDIFAARSHKTAKYFAKHWRRKDWWLDADECLELGIVDEVR